MSQVERTLRATSALLVAKRWDPTASARDTEGRRVEAIWPAESYSLCGAITHACAGDYDLDCKITVHVLGSEGLTKPEQLTHWENAPGRTLEDVLALLERAIAAGVVT